MNLKENNKFNFFIPAEFVKGGKAGEEMYIKGVASSEVEDSDGETLIPNGYDLTPLLSSGFLNYNHQTNSNPDAVIGEPTKAEIINNGKDLYIEGYLYKDSELARKTYNLALVLEKNSPNRRMGFSIEGKALERDPMNPKRITRAKITGVAITPSPKNPNTLLSIMKGEYAEQFVDSMDLSTLEKEYKRWCDGDSHYGQVDSVKEFLENNYEDHMHLLDDLHKAITAAAGEGVTQVEDVDGGGKVLKDLLSSKSDLKKSEVYQAIFNKYSLDSDTLDQAKQIFKIIKGFNNKINGMENTDNTILTKAVQEAFAFLDNEIKKSSHDEKIDKDEEEVIDEVEIVEKEDEDDKDEVKKGVEGFSIDNVESELNKTYGGLDVYLKNTIKAAFGEGSDRESIVSNLVERGVEYAFASNAVDGVAKEMSELKANGDISNEGIKPEPVTIAPSTFSKNPELEKGDTLNELIKGQLNERFSSIANILKENNKVIDSLQKSNVLLTKENSVLRGSFDQINDRIQALESTPQATKSVFAKSQYHERFDDNIEKSHGNKKTYSMRSESHLKMLANDLLAHRSDQINKGADYSNVVDDAILEIEISKGLDGETLGKLQPTLSAMNIELQF